MTKSKKITHNTCKKQGNKSLEEQLSCMVAMFKVSATQQGHAWAPKRMYHRGNCSVTQEAFKADICASTPDNNLGEIYLLFLFFPKSPFQT